MTQAHCANAEYNDNCAIYDTTDMDIEETRTKDQKDIHHRVRVFIEHGLWGQRKFTLDVRLELRVPYSQ